MTKNQFGCYYYYFGARYDLNLDRNRPVICQMFRDLSSVFFFLRSPLLVVPGWISIKTLFVRFHCCVPNHHRSIFSIIYIYIPIWIFPDDNNHFFFLRAIMRTSQFQGLNALLNVGLPTKYFDLPIYLYI